MEIEDYALKIVYGLFSATVIVALFMAIYQFFFERKRIYLLSIFYWTSILFSSVINMFVAEKESNLYLLSIVSTFISQAILASVMGQIKGVKLDLKKISLFFLSALFLTETLKILGVSFEIYVFVGIFGAVFPVFYVLYLVLKNKKNSFTSAQWLFYFFCILLTIHFLDYSFFKANKKLFVVGSAIAFFLMHVISTLIPMVVNEYHLYIRNLNLEEEIQQRIIEIRKKDQQLWEANKLEVMGRFSGVLAHELNTPITAISIAVSSIYSAMTKNITEKEKIFDKLEKIKMILKQITNMTSTLRAASGDQMGLEMSQIDLREVYLSHEAKIKEFCEESGIAFSSKITDEKCFIRGNSNEISQVIKTLVLNSVQELKNTPEAWIKIELKKEKDFYLLSFVDTRKNFSRTRLGGIKNDFVGIDEIGLDLVVVKSILETHRGALEFDFEMTNYKTITKFPIDIEA